MEQPIDLDHVALAAEHQALAWPRLTGDLGGTWVSGGPSTGFTAAQVRFANGMKVEVLEPHLVEQNDFLRRFLDASGPGPHHLTFKVADLDVALERVRAAGIEPVGIDRSDPGWQEAFLHPRQAHGVVVQLAQSDGAWESDPPPDLPPAARPTATLDHVTHVVPDLAAAAALFGDLLGGTEVGGTEAGGSDAGGPAPEGATHLDLSWPGGGCIRLVAPSGDEGSSPWSAWLDGGRGRVHHLAFTLDDPASVPGAIPTDDAWVIPPDRDLGVRFVLRST